MEEVSQEVIYQRVRNRVIELLDMYSSFDDVATVGAYEMINMVDDQLPLDYDKAPKVFSEKEKEIINKFMELVDGAADATTENVWDVVWFKNSVEWVKVSEFAKQALAVFSERGRFSEEHEDVLIT